MSKPLSSDFANWLENLQRESWNLELIISGFSIFLLTQFIDLLADTLHFIQFSYHLNQISASIVVALLGSLLIGTSALIINLIIHIFLRGIWIGTIGLRSVQRDINYEKLNYSSFFSKKLKKNIQDLDQLIVQLDTICSVIFSFTFLVFFMLLSLVLYFLGLVVILQVGTWIGAKNSTPALVFVMGLSLIYSVLGLIYFVDTLTSGLLKKNSLLSRVYYPFYIFFNFITLSFVYQTIYYLLISRFSKWKFGLFLFVYLFAIFNFPFFRVTDYFFYPDSRNDAQFYQSVYDNLREEDRYIGRASIPQDVTHQRFIPLFINYQVKNNPAIEYLCDDYTPSKTSSFISGITFDKGLQVNDPIIEEADAKALLRCLARSYNLYLNDSLLTQQQFYYFEHSNKGEKGLRTVIDTKHLESGQHHIQINQWELKKDSLTEENYITIPFWLEK